MVRLLCHLKPVSFYLRIDNQNRLDYDVVWFLIHIKIAAASYYL